MITPIKSMTIAQITERNDDLLVSVEDVKAIAKNEREKVLKEIKDQTIIFDGGSEYGKDTKVILLTSDNYEKFFN